MNKLYIFFLICFLSASTFANPNQCNIYYNYFKANLQADLNLSDALQRKGYNLVKNKTEATFEFTYWTICTKSKTNFFGVECSEKISTVNITNLKNNYNTVQISKTAKELLFGLIRNKAELASVSFSKALKSLPECSEHSKSVNVKNFEYGTSIREYFEKSQGQSFSKLIPNGGILACLDFDVRTGKYKQRFSAKIPYIFDDKGDLILSTTLGKYKLIRETNQFSGIMEYQEDGVSYKFLMTLREDSNGKLRFELADNLESDPVVGSAHLGLNEEKSVVNASFYANDYIVCD